MEKRFENIYLKRFLYFNIYVIKGENGDILIDTGFIGMKKRLKKWLDNFDIRLVILTHAHVDHLWNVNYIKKLYNCEVVMSKLDLENLDNTKINSTPFKDEYIKWTKLMNFGMRKFVPKDVKIDYLLEDNQIISNYGIDLKVVSLPGHTKGSIGILYNDYLFAGDALVNRKKHPEVAYQNQDNKAAIASYKKILEINPKIIFVGHDKEILFDEMKEVMINEL